MNGSVFNSHVWSVASLLQGEGNSFNQLHIAGSIIVSNSLWIKVLVMVFMLVLFTLMFMMFFMNFMWFTSFMNFML